jgi:hypothetical protein
VTGNFAVLVSTYLVQLNAALSADLAAAFRVPVNSVSITAVAVGSGGNLIVKFKLPKLCSLLKDLLAVLPLTVTLSATKALYLAHGGYALFALLFSVSIAPPTPVLGS